MLSQFIYLCFFNCTIYLIQVGMIMETVVFWVVFFWYFVGRLVVRYSISEEFASFTISCMGKSGSGKERQGPGN